MTPDKNNFCFHNDGSDDAKNACVMMYENQNAGRVVGGYYGKLKGVNFCDLELNDLRPSLVTPAEAIKLMQGDDLKDYYVAEAQKWQPKVGDVAMFRNRQVYVHGINDIHVWISYDGTGPFTDILASLSPIAKPVTMEDELHEVVDKLNCGEYNSIEAKNDISAILINHNRHAPEPLEVTDEEIKEYWKNNINIYQQDIGKLGQLVRHFLNLQRGGRG